jgi:hypothetical protein
MTTSTEPRIYHIVHVDRLASIIADGCLWCDATVLLRSGPGTTIGMARIKRRRLEELTLESHPGLHVGDCVPFYFCPRSIMLYLIYKANSPDLTYRGGQGAIIHLEADLHRAIAWASQHGLRWAFTLSNAGSYHFEDRCDVAQLDEIDWDAVHNDRWGYSGVPSTVGEVKQAEFLVEQRFPWELVSRIGVHSESIRAKVADILQTAVHQPHLEVKPGWYY